MSIPLMSYLPLSENLQKSRGDVSPKMWPSALLYWMIGWNDPNKIRGKYTLNYSSSISHLKMVFIFLIKLVFDWFPHLQVQILILSLTYSSSLTLCLVFRVTWTVFSFSFMSTPASYYRLLHLRQYSRHTTLFSLLLPTLTSSVQAKPLY